MTDQHPITPPPLELVDEWDFECGPEENAAMHIATRAARWGADQELEACCDWLHWQNLATHADLIPSLRAARRPKPTTLKERGRKALQSIHNAVVMETGGRELDVLKEIVESLPD